MRQTPCILYTAITPAVACDMTWKETKCQQEITQKQKMSSLAHIGATNILNINFGRLLLGMEEEPRRSAWNFKLKLSQPVAAHGNVCV